MKLKIPSEDAIEILEKRKKELFEYNFDPIVWKGKTQNDLNEIFEIGDTKWIQISNIKFTSLTADSRISALQKGKNQASEYLDSYIEQIRKYSEIKAKSISENERYYESENIRLNSELSDVLHNANILLDERKEFINEIEQKNKTIKHLEDNTVQLNKITLNKLFGLIKDLPLNQTITLLSTFFAIIAFSFYLGSLIKENVYLKNEYEKQKLIDETNQKNNDLKKQNLLLKKQLENLNNKPQKK